MNEISRDQVRDIAIQFLREQPGWGKFIIDQVRTWDEITCRKPCPYRHGTFDPQQCRIVYVHDPDDCSSIRSSTVIVISKAWGQVVACGCANDEG